MVLLYLPVIFLGIVYILYWFSTRSFNYWKERNVAGPEPLALFGNIKDSAFRRKTLGNVLEELYVAMTNEKVIGFYTMTSPCLLLRDLEVIKHVLIKDFSVFSDRGLEFSRKGLGANLFHADGETWRVLRKQFTPIFTSRKLKSMFFLINEGGNKFIDDISDICLQNPEQEVHSLAQTYTLSTISSCAFGIEIEHLQDKLETLQLISKNVFTVTFFTEIDMMFPGILKILNRSRFPAAITFFFCDLVKSILTQRNSEPSNRKDFMDLLIELKQKRDIQGIKREDQNLMSLRITDEIIAAQAFIFYVAGYETSASTLSFMLYQLALNQDIQNKIVAEIEEVLQGKDITYESLSEMKYLKKVFDETLRMYPILDNLQRYASASYKIPGTNVTVEKGQTVFISVSGIHHDETYYPDPDFFNPERFDPEVVKNRHACAYMPFGTGPRNCIGMRFAIVQSMVCVIKLLSKFRVEPSKNTTKKMTFVPNVAIKNALGGIYLNLIPR